MPRITAIRLALVCLLGLVVAPAVAGAQTQTDLSGAWIITVAAPQGKSDFDATFKQAGERLSGQVSNAMGSVDLTGTFVKGTLTIRYQVPLQGQMLEINMTGTPDADGGLSGTLDFGGFGQAPWTARRKPPSAAADAAPSTPPAVAATGLGGTWTLTLALGPISMPLTAALTQNGDAITGTMSTALGSAPVTGHLTGSSVTLQFIAPLPQGAVPVTLNGTLGADRLTGTADLPGVGQATWSGVRAQ